MLKIYGRASSANVQKVTWLCTEIGLPYERQDVGGEYGGNDQDWYLKLNPNGRVPTIDDGGYVLWESNAIIRYLAEKHAPDWAGGSDLQRRGLIGDCRDDLDLPRLGGADRQVTASRRQLQWIAEGCHAQHFDPRAGDDAELHQATAKCSRAPDLFDHHRDARNHLLESQHPRHGL